jgi:hypothetical protein
MSLSQLTLLIPFYGPYLEYKRLVTSHGEPFEDRIGYAIVAGGATGAHFILGQRHLAHLASIGHGSAFDYLLARKHQRWFTRTLPALVVGYGLVTTSVAYEVSVNKSIRSGQRNIWFGPFSSGFGSVV